METPPRLMIRAHMGGIAKENLRVFPLRKGFDLRVFLLEPSLDQGIVALLRALQRLLASDAELRQQSTNRIGASTLTEKSSSNPNQRAGNTTLRKSREGNTLPPYESSTT
jgi:hypothetical protein